MPQRYRSALVCFILFNCFSFFAMGQAQNVKNPALRIEPPHWWTGFKENRLQLMVHHKGIANCSVHLTAAGVTLDKTTPGKSENYLFIDLTISPSTTAGTIHLSFLNKEEIVLTTTYELKQRKKAASDFIGFDQSDVVYLITPDRFANGDPSNDQYTYLKETRVDRNDDYARHGGDIAGLINNLDYIADLGFTALWSSPLLINDMPEQSYHGYAMTDFYQVDPRFGSLAEYIDLARQAQKKGIKLIMDQVANHCGLNHWWMNDLPFSDWVNYQDRFEAGAPLINSNHRRTTNQDHYAAQYDKNG